MKCSGNRLRSPLMAGWPEELSSPEEGIEDWDTAGFGEMRSVGLDTVGESQAEDVAAKWP